MNDLYAIVGIAKLKTAGNIQGVLSHMMRTRPTPNSDGRENHVMINPPALPDIMAEINSYQPRKNAVLCYDLLLTASPEFFAGKSEADIKAWAETSLQWACDKFGKHNIKGAVLHLDEMQTGSPHIQAVVICEYQNKLNARHYTGGREKMRKLWTEYAGAMKQYGLKRGREFSPAKHKQIKEFYADVKRGIELSAGRNITADELPAPGMGDRLDPKEYAVKLINRVADFYRKQNGNLKAELEATRRELEQVTTQTANDRKQYREMKENPEIINELREALRAEAKGRATIQTKYERLLSAVGEYFRRNISKNSFLRKPEILGALQDFPELKKEIQLSLTPDAKERQGMTLTRGL